MINNREKIITVLLCVCILTACSPKNTIASDSLIRSKTNLVKFSTPIPSKTKTQTLTISQLPTTTPPPSKTSTTTLTPTLDVSNIQAITPNESAICPIQNEIIIPPDLSKYDVSDFGRIYLEYFDQGGSISALGPSYFPNFEVDLTGDGVAELLIQNRGLWIFGCDNGKYLLNFEILPGNIAAPKIVEIKDANLNGVSEILLRLTVLSQGGEDYTVLEWEKNEFKSIIAQNVGLDVYDGIVYVPGPKQPPSFVDLDGNGKDELVFYLGPTGIGLYVSGFPYREETRIFAWNGKEYIFEKRVFELPIYRFQAIQDADKAMSESDYETALYFYRQAIENEKLEWWSPERRENIKEAIINSINNEVTPTPLSLENNEEYYHLAAYAYYRIMILNLIQGKTDQAKMAYDTLQMEIPLGHSGSEITEMANEFWEEYHVSGNIGNACEKAVKYASKNKTLLTYIGAAHHGEQSKIYQPNDVCPFQ